MSLAEQVSHITCSVWAEMKKTVSYKVDIAIDEHRVIRETHCECAVGQGPTAHCKHVGCIVYGLHCFGNDRHIITAQTCTQVRLI